MGVCLLETMWLVQWWRVLGDEGLLGDEGRHKRSTNISTNHQLERHMPAGQENVAFSN